MTIRFQFSAGATFAAALFLVSTVSVAAANDQEPQLIYQAVKDKFPSFADYCKLPDDERRKLVVQTTMALAAQRKLSNPMGAGPSAGLKLRSECGDNSAATDSATIRWMTFAKPLAFDSARHTLEERTVASDLANRVFAPVGPGPFPAVVINQTKGISDHLLVHAKSLIAAGFAVLVVDTYGPRGYRIGVNEPAPAEFAKDAYDALGHLLRLSFIDTAHVYQTGYSNGGNAAALLASPQGAIALKAPGRFRATVANYGTCSTSGYYTGTQKNVAGLELLSADSDRPILMLMGELDIETPPKLCFPLLEQMKAAGKPVEWHIYPKATHGWDKRENDGHIYRTTSGDAMTYTYDATVTQDATNRMISFFNRHR